MHLRQDGVARSNIGILNAGRRQTRVQVELFDGWGAEVASFEVRVEPREIEQFNQPFADPGGRTDVATGYAVLTVLDGEEVVVYGSVVDAGTNDPTTIPMKTGGGATTAHVAAAAHVDGVAGSVWRTDLGILNTGADATAISVVFHQTDGPDLTTDLVLESGQHRVLEDVVGLLGGEGSGSLEILAELPVLVSSRTYSQGDLGTFGQYLDGLSGADTVSAGASVWLSQLQQSSEHRTNIGLHNSGITDAEVELRLHDADGSVLSTSQHLVAAGDRIQLQEPFDHLAGRSDIDSGYAVVEVVSGSGISAYASVIDNRSNDPTTIPMAR
jgi:hypothetical protein